MHRMIQLNVKKAQVAYVDQPINIQNLLLFELSRISLSLHSLYTFYVISCI